MDTAGSYRARFAQLQARYRREVGVWDWKGFTTWLISLFATMRPATRRQYRAAVVFVLSEQRVQGVEELVARLRTPVQSSTRLPRRTSSMKAKTMSKRDWLFLAMSLKESNGRWHMLAYQWIFWGMRTGLRPVEWQRATLATDASHGYGFALHVANAKHSQGRAHGPERILHLRLDPDEAGALLQFMHVVQASYPQAYAGCRGAVSRAARALWPQRRDRPTLYTARHQFCANLKASALALPDIAALMGHASVHTNQQHYGKRRCGRAEGIVVEPDERDVTRVRERMQRDNPPNFGLAR